MNMKSLNLSSTFCFLGWVIWLLVSIGGLLLVFPFMLLAMADVLDDWKNVGDRFLDGFVKRKYES